MSPLGQKILWTCNSINTTIILLLSLLSYIWEFFYFDSPPLKCYLWAPMLEAQSAWGGGQCPPSPSRKHAYGIYIFIYILHSTVWDIIWCLTKIYTTILLLFCYIISINIWILFFIKINWRAIYRLNFGAKPMSVPLEAPFQRTRQPTNC